MEFTKCLQLVLLLLTMLGCPLSLPCKAQESTELDEFLSPDVLARPEVSKILQQLRFLKNSDAQYGENHPKKAATQARIVEYQQALRGILTNLALLKEESKLASKGSSSTTSKGSSSNPSKGASSTSSSNIEDTLPKEMEDRSDVAVIVRKLKFARLNIANLGEKHPKRPEILRKIEEHELALKRLLRLDTESSSESTTSEGGAKESIPLEDSLSQEVLDNDNVSRLVRQLLHMRLLVSSYSEGHPDLSQMLEQLSDQEETLIAVAKSVSPRSILRKSRPEGQMSMIQKLESRSEIQSLVNQLAILRLSLENFRDEGSKYKTIQGKIRELESELRDMIKKP